MHPSTAFARSGLMLRILSSAFGDFMTKFSHASKRVAEGDVEPGLKTESVEAWPKLTLKNAAWNEIEPLTGNLLNEVRRFLANDTYTDHLSDGYSSAGVEIPIRIW